MGIMQFISKISVIEFFFFFFKILNLDFIRPKLLSKQSTLFMSRNIKKFFHRLRNYRMFIIISPLIVEYENFCKKAQKSIFTSSKYQLFEYKAREILFIILQ